uniref:Protein E6 n=1 Tax=Human papillomavirus TaxID=10566 RepID=A0A385PN34_9PAPI|nr:MAG: E6 protein [Human papillomavirus]
MEHPRTVLELSKLLEIPVEDLLIPCNFCGAFLDYFELCDFEAKVLTLIWKGDLVFGCCHRCCTATAQFEFNTFYEQTVVGREIEAVEHKSIFDICVRCRHCLRCLDIFDKLDICGRQQHFYKVRSAWKGLCRLCK